MAQKNEGSRILLNKVASLTSIRDIEVFEFSFLKTLAEMLKAEEICIYKFNSFHQPCRLLRYSSETEKTNNTQKTHELKEVQIDNIEVPEKIRVAKEWIELTGKVYCSHHDGIYHMVYLIQGAKGIVGYLSLNLRKQLSEAENMVIASLLSISNNFHTLLEENQKDKLTGLLNRKTFDENITKILNTLSTIDENDVYTGIDHRQEKNANEFWLAILDIDHFKRINDDFGHVFGDEILLLFSQTMKKTFRPRDLLFRFGGEEFIAIIQVDNQQQATEVFERFRLIIEKFPFPQVNRTTVSIGATKISETHVIPSDIVGRADQALYHAKNHGRNKLFFYENLVKEGVIKEKVEEGDIELF